MKLPLTAAIPGLSLHQLVNNIVSDYLPAALVHQTRLINEVERQLVIDNQDAQAITIISELLSTVINNSNRGDIHVSAERYGDVIIFNIQERNNYNGYALSYSIGAIEPEAVSVGGHIVIRGAQQKVTTISFSFPIVAQAA